jgi:hypothetical protein
VKISTVTDLLCLRVQMNFHLTVISVREITGALRLMSLSDHDFRENQHTESHTLLTDVDKFLSTFTVRCG